MSRPVLPAFRHSTAGALGEGGRLGFRRAGRLAVRAAGGAAVRAGAVPGAAGRDVRPVPARHVQERGGRRRVHAVPRPEGHDLDRLDEPRRLP